MRRGRGASIAVVITAAAFAAALAPGAASAQVVLNEVVTDPQTDWNDTAGGDGDPFAGAPGNGNVTSSDEYIEIYNAGASTIDLTGWTIEMIDSTPETHAIGVGSGTEVFSAGSVTSFPPGAYLVVGNPTGANNNDVQIALRDGGGFIVDLVTLDATASPGYGRNGNAGGPLDESVSRALDGVDTDDAIADWAPRPATPGSANPSPAPAPPGAVLVNEVVTDPQTDWDDSSGGGNGVRCDATPGTGAAGSDDEYVELLNATASSTFDLTAWILEMEDTTAAVDYLVLDEPLEGSECAPSSFSPGCHLVLCNPGGVLNNTVTLRLRDSLNNVVETVDVADGNASSRTDESVSRLPDGADTGDDAADFGRYLGTPGAANPVDEGAAALVINEAVTDPQSDWNDTAGGNGAPFDDVPGTDAATATDEYIEIANPTGESVNVVGWNLEMNDGTDAVYTIGSGDAVEVYSAGSSASELLPGGYLVIGNPPGAVNNQVELVLRDLFGNEADRVAIGGGGAPAPGRSGNVDGPEDEAISRSPDGADTDADAADFTPRAGTPGAANPSPAAASPGDVLLNEVVADPVLDWDDSSGASGAPFDGAPGAGAASASDQWIELKNASGATLDLTGWRIEMIDAEADTEFLGLDGAAFYAEDGACAPETFTAGCYLVVGNPRGDLSTAVFLRLADSVGTEVDAVELGDDPEGDGDGDGAPGGASTGANDEAVARLPDATDTGDDDADFARTLGTPAAANTEPPPPLPDAGAPGDPDAGAAPDGGPVDASLADGDAGLSDKSGGGGCGCDTGSPASSSLFWIALALLALRWRRRPTSPHPALPPEGGG